MSIETSFFSSKAPKERKVCIAKWHRNWSGPRAERFAPSDPNAVDWKAAYRKELESRFPTPSSLRLYLQEIEKRTPDPILCCFELNPEECHRRVLAAFIKGVDEYQELLRCSVAFAGNDHRLGAQEAPPAVISIFLGTELEGIIDAIVGENDYTAPEHKSLRIGVDVLPAIPQDTTDRNRTSPVAFTGNKFEFRMPGSSQSIAGPVTILNTIMAEELDEFYAQLKDAPDFTAALHKLIRDTFSAHRRIIFNGNGYEDAWIKEAEKRGLANLHNTAEALPTYILPKNIELLTRQGVYSKEEIFSRHEVHIEKYCKVIRIEAATLVDMVQHGILNAASEYEAALCNTIAAKRAAAPELTCHVESSLANAIGSLNEQLLEETISLKTALETVSDNAEPETLLHYYHDEVEERTNDVRKTVDKLEVLTASKYWPYPTFCELLFSV